MNTEDVVYLQLLSEEEKLKTIIWSHNLNSHSIFLPRKIFWFIYKNIPILKQDGEPLRFEKWNEAYEFFKSINKNGHLLYK